MMVKYNGFLKKIASKPAVIALIVLLVLFLVYVSFLYNKNKQNGYRIENKYYGFDLKTPKGWIAQGKILYSENNIAEILAECKKDVSGQAHSYEVGRFIFKDKKYPQDFGEKGNFPAGLPSGGILDIAINCIPDALIKDFSEEEIFSEFLDLPGFGITKYLSFFHDNLQYSIKEYVYIPPAEKMNENSLRKKYAEIYDRILSSFKLTR